MRDVLLKFTNKFVKLWRNNVGLFHTQDGRMIMTGLCKGSSDIIGLKSIIITPEMVGSRLAVFVAIETKSEKGVATDEQINFVKTVNDLGGIAGIVRTVDDVKILLGENTEEPQ